MTDPDSFFRHERERMVREQIAGRGIADQAVLRAMREVPREAFVDDALRDRAYDDSPLPIGARQTISQPYIVGLMLEAARLHPSDRVLEVGAGSGYACAIISRIVARVVAIERHAELAELAARRLRELGYDNVELHTADGSAGWPAAAPYDAILVAASGPQLPQPLLEQLADDGRLVMPVGPDGAVQRLRRATRTGPASWHEDDLGAVMFVPLVGTEGWADAASRSSGAPLTFDE